MIGRTLDAILSPFQEIAKECRSAGVDSPSLYLVNALRNMLLPVEKCKYGSIKENNEVKTIIYKDNWSKYFPEDWELKRECAKVFEKRRKVEIGNSFDQKAKLHTGFGTFNKKFEAKRIAKDAITYKDYLISSNKETLIENENKGYTPILYRGVIW